MPDQFPKINWTESQRTLLTELLDEIIPASDDGRIPSAGSLNVVDFITDKTMEVSGLGELLTRGLQTMLNKVMRMAVSFDKLPRKDRIALIKELEQQEPDFFTKLVRYSYMGYYTNPQIPPLFGLSEKPPHPHGYTISQETPADIAALVEPVKKRGTCYQRC